jgi:hypothetical protein
MHIAVITFFVLVVVYLWTLVGCTQSQTQLPTRPPIGGNPPAVKQKTAHVEAGKAALKKRLVDLASSPAPAKLSMGAMCYDMAMPPNKATYVCPLCGERTLHSQEKPGFFGLGQVVQYDIPTMRRSLKTIKGLKVELDESEFCNKCKPDTKSPLVVLEVKHAGEPKPHCVRGVRPSDIRLLAEFMAGKKKHKSFNDGETPLKKHIKRISELIGVRVDD